MHWQLMGSKPIPAILSTPSSQSISSSNSAFICSQVIDATVDGGGADLTTDGIAYVDFGVMEAKGAAD
jgi:hypothetical protein